MSDHFVFLEEVKEVKRINKEQIEAIKEEFRGLMASLSEEEIVTNFELQKELEGFHALLRSF